MFPDDYFTKGFVLVEDSKLYAIVPNYKGLLDKAEVGALELVKALEKRGCKLIDSEIDKRRALFVLVCRGVHPAMAYIKCNDYGCVKKVISPFPPLQKLLAS